MTANEQPKTERHLHGLLQVLSENTDFRAATEAFQSGVSAAVGGAGRDGGPASEGSVVATEGIRPALLAQWASDAPLLVVTPTGQQAEDTARELKEFLDPETVGYFPSWETLPHERLSPRPDTVAQRIEILRRLQGTDPRPLRVLTLPIRALIQPVISALGTYPTLQINSGQELSLTETVNELVVLGYQRVDLVERRGQFALRGGIVDVFVPNHSAPVRIELWGDEVDSIREFSVADQRSFGDELESVTILAGREILLTDQVRAQAQKLAGQLPGAADMLSQIAAGQAVEGMESLAGLLVEDIAPFLSSVPKGWRTVVLDPERQESRVVDLIDTAEEFLQAAWHAAADSSEGSGTDLAGDQTSANPGANKIPLDLSTTSFYSFAEVAKMSRDAGFGWWQMSAFTTDETAVHLPARQIESYRGRLHELYPDLARHLRDGWQMVFVADGPGSATRISHQLSEASVPARIVNQLDFTAHPGVVQIVVAYQRRGFVLGERIAVFSERDLTGRNSSNTPGARRIPSKRRNMVDPLALKAGDFIVHERHGIGKFVELVQRQGAGGGAQREYLLVEYAASKRGGPADRLYVPTDQLDQVSKYTGGEAPALSKLGGSDWAKTKSKARAAVKEIAGELVRLYTARMAAQGHAFGPDTPWQRELEESFAHVETADQLVTIDEVKADMEKSVPMDRLICGDVGYGKTEIAVRAAFKAVQDGKQVVVLVPTTLLVQQHVDTFSDRYAQYPVTVKALSRFQSTKEAEQIRKDLRAGKVDVVIGTHRLLTGQVHFKDLGLVIIDEEQRFGVEHKEALKQLRTNVDVLAMSATPIPRTLEMAVTGIRQMSTLATPPEDRHPILTYVGAYDENQVSAAIKRELLREGQVFFVHNRVSSLAKTAARLAELVPDARIAYAHGQMSEQQLERVILDFWNKEIDVLVTTTIVETGLDISNANTLIVDRADRLGLSQLHQLRGRVGRGRDRGYAYFLYPSSTELTETAHDRLSTIASHNELGAGMQVAMKDLEIRGAGNLLGGEQSGHIAGVGFDLYVRMVSEALDEVQGKQGQELEVSIELPIEAHVPHDYVDSERLRLELYSKFSACKSQDDIDRVVSEAIDRYGPIPPAVANLVAVAQLRNMLRAAGIAEIGWQGKYIRFAPLQLPESMQLRLNRVYPGSITKLATRTVLVPVPQTAKVGGKPLRDLPLLEWVHEFLENLQLVSTPADVSDSLDAEASR